MKIELRAILVLSFLYEIITSKVLPFNKKIVKLKKES
jgi:hypothetical protein